MIFREAVIGDIAQIQFIRNSVTENMLSDPGLVTDKDCEEYLTVRGKGWVCEVNGAIVGFAIADLKADNVWALFVHPQWHGKRIGKRLHDTMLDWYFSKGKERLWLSTSPLTRAEKFYRMGGWTETGKYGKGEIKFEMTRSEWNQCRPEEGSSDIE